MKIAVDAMGGDYAPEEVVLGAIEAVKSYSLDVVLVGDTTGTARSTIRICPSFTPAMSSIWENIRLRQSAKRRTRRLSWRRSW